MTEQEIAENGAAAGAQVGKKAWTYGNLAPTGYNNITEMVNAIGLGKGYIIDHHVAYGSITLDSPRKQNTQMWVGSDDSVKVWLNGVLVHNNPADRGTNEYNENLPATLKKGKNILLVAVYNGLGAWSGFFGFKKDTIYSPVITSLVHINSAERPPIYWIDTEAGTLHRLIGDAVEDLLPDVQNATSLTIDPTDNKIYWTEQTGKNMGSIKHANLDGSNLQILATLQGTATSFAVDVANNTLYWTTSSEKIRWANLNGEQTQDLIHKLEAPSNIILDAAAGKLYWTEAPGRIQRANLNGKKVENIASGLEAVGDLSILGNKIYWTEKTGENTGKIGRTNLNGSGFTTLIKLQQAPTGLAIDAVGRKLYWSDSGGNIKRSNLNGKKIQNVVSSLGAPINIVLGSAPAAPAAAPTQVAEIPDQTVLLANYPNPFNPETWIPYQLAKPSDVQITIYNARGLVVKQLALGHQPAGTYTSRSRAAYWDGRNSQGERVASGIYFYQFQADNVSSLRKMLILK